MKIGFERRLSLTGRTVAIISILSIIISLLLFSIIFIVDGVSPIEGYKEIFFYAFLNPRGLYLTINRFIFLLICTVAFIIPFRAGLWNIGMTGQFYLGALGAFAVPFVLPNLSSGALIPLMLIAAALCGAAAGAIAGLLRGKWNVNEIVTTMMLNFVAFWLVSFMIKEGGPFMNPGGRGESFELPVSAHAPMIHGVPFTIFLALGIAVLIFFVFAKTKIGFQIRALGRNPNAARYAGVDPLKISALVFIAGGAIAGVAGYHYFGAIPGVYKIQRNYGQIGDMAFYGIIFGLISTGNPLAAVPVALFFGGITVGGTVAQGKFQMGFGMDYALLGILTITLIAFQFFYRYKIVLERDSQEE